MNFKQHSGLDGKHSFLSPSNWHWLNYDDERLASRYLSHDAAQRGTELHAFASTCIKLREKLMRSKCSLNAFVNDAIGFKMNSEQILYFSDFCFGTADAISFNKGLLRIHDLKTGESKGSMNQLAIYAAIFCLEYDQNPEDIRIELRIYQFDEIDILEPEPADIRTIMDKILYFDKQLTLLNAEGR